MKKWKIYFLFVNLFISTLLFSQESINDIQSDDIANEIEYKLIKEYDNQKDWGQLLFLKISQSFLNGYGINIGADLLFAYFPENSIREWLYPVSQHMIGIDYQYQFAKNNSVLHIDYTYFFFHWIIIGLVNSYNINKNEFGLGPKIGLHLRISVLPIKIDIDYRYNFIINNKDNNFQEIVLSFGIFPPFLW